VKANVNNVAPPGLCASVYFKHQTDQIKIVVVGVFYKITDFHLYFSPDQSLLWQSSHARGVHANRQILRLYDQSKEHAGAEQRDTSAGDSSP